MDAKQIPLFALLFSVVACALGVAAIALRRDLPIAVAANPDADADRVQALASQVAELRAEVGRLARDPREGPALRQPLESAPRQAGSSPEILERLKELESSVSTLQRQSKERPGRIDPLKDDSADTAAEARRVATDPSASEEQRLAALRTLRGQLAGGKYPYANEVVLSMLDLAEHSTDEKTRVDVYRNLHGVPDAAVRDSMLRALASDPSAKVRKKVAEDIDKFLPDLTVEGALRQAADNDADDGVRAMALTTLAGKH